MKRKLKKLKKNGVQKKLKKFLRVISNMSIYSIQKIMSMTRRHISSIKRKKLTRANSTKEKGKVKENKFSKMDPYMKAIS